MERTVHLVRHGRTAWNRVHRTMGWRDEPIEDDQRAAAEAVAARLAPGLGDAGPPGHGAGRARVLSSPVRRAVQTAGPTAAALEVDVELDERLGELRVGSWEGLLESEVAEQHPEAWATWRSSPHTLELEGRETLDALYGRVGDLLDELSADAASAHRPVVAFTHDAVVRAAVAWAVGAGPTSYRSIEVANCSLTTLAVGEGRRRLVRANDTCHLGPGVG
ncbi:MAG TPA: histidine phosphatase family protein [Acidimicrobiales bacterium]|nr:histidine phosphatase family protein [Acidimicrobiales bacterium]